MCDLTVLPRAGPDGDWAAEDGPSPDGAEEQPDGGPHHHGRPAPLAAHLKLHRQGDFQEVGSERVSLYHYPLSRLRGLSLLERE